MTHVILSNLTASITELKKHPMATVNSAEGEPLAIINRMSQSFIVYLQSCMKRSWMF